LLVAHRPRLTDRPTGRCLPPAEEAFVYFHGHEGLAVRTEGRSPDRTVSRQRLADGFPRAEVPKPISLVRLGVLDDAVDQGHGAVRVESENLEGSEPVVTLERLTRVLTCGRVPEVDSLIRCHQDCLAVGPEGRTLDRVFVLPRLKK